jgi:chromosome segregation ATPase
LDFTNLLNEKENQIVELEKKIQNLEERLRRASAREVELENKIVALRAENLSLRDKSLTGDKLYNAVQREADLDKSLKDIETLRSNFAAAASVWKNQLSRLTAKYPTERADLDFEITNILQRANVSAYAVNGIEIVEVSSSKTV